jgi:hypothetical protein
MIRQLLTRRPHHVSCTALPIKVCYSQAPASTLNAVLSPQKEDAKAVSYLAQCSIRVLTEPHLHQYPEPGPTSSTAETQTQGPGIVDGLLTVQGTRNRWVVLVTQINDRET